MDVSVLRWRDCRRLVQRSRNESANETRVSRDDSENDEAPAAGSSRLTFGILNSTAWRTLDHVFIAGNIEQRTAVWAEEKRADFVC